MRARVYCKQQRNKITTLKQYKIELIKHSFLISVYLYHRLFKKKDNHYNSQIDNDTDKYTVTFKLGLVYLEISCWHWPLQPLRLSILVD
jgi:hypothetical protein